MKFWRKFSIDVYKNRMFLCLTIPLIIWQLMFAYAPMFGLVIAFINLDYSKGIFGSDWVGLKNFDFIFKSKDLFVVTRNTILYNLLWIPLGLVCSITFAIMYDALGRKKVHAITKISQTLSIMPHFLSIMVVSYFLGGFLDIDNGIANNIIKMFGGSPINWYAEPKFWPYILTIVNIWQSVGWGSIVYYSTIRGFPTDMYEAAWIDGANWYGQLRYITLPLLKHVVTLLLIMNVSVILSSDFGLFYILPKNSGMLYPTTSTLDTYIYNGLVTGGDLGITGAVSLCKSVVGCILVLGTNAIARKFTPDSALF